jgi:hypothetical protein
LDVEGFPVWLKVVKTVWLEVCKSARRRGCGSDFLKAESQTVSSDLHSCKGLVLRQCGIYVPLADELCDLSH